VDIARLGSLEAFTAAMKRSFPNMREAGIFVVLCASALLWTAAKKPPFPTVKHHNIRVLKQVDENKWWMADDETPAGFLYTGCRDFPNASVIWEGYIAREARWQEQGACKSIQRSDLGFWWRSRRTIQR
jgi:hypothetical protein